MNTPHSRVSLSRRRTLIVALLWITVILVNVLACGILDLIFRGQKADLILRDRSVDRQFSQYAQLAQRIFEGRTRPVVYPAVTARLNQVLQAPDSFFYGYEFYRYQSNQVLETAPELSRFNQAKFRRRNNWSNSFISRGFDKYYKVPVESGYLYWYYTTPNEVEGLRPLVLTFQAMAAVILLASATLAWLVQRYVLRAMVSVSMHLDRPFGDARSIIRAPFSQLEESYNQLALNAHRAELAARLAGVLTEDPAKPPGPDGEMTAALAVLRRETGADVAAFYSRQDEGAWACVFRRDGTVQAPDRMPAGAGEEAARCAPLPDASDSAHSVIICLEADLRQPGLLLLAWPTQAEAESFNLARCEPTRRAVESFLLRVHHREMLLDREKTAVGIHLATNMGHDLTNVIATSRWDLATLEKARERGWLNVDPERGPAVEAALSGLVNNFRLLQEMVELYRAYGYAERPTFAELDLGELARGVCDLFRRSSSRRLRLDIDAPETPAMLVGERRLLALAVFNLLANAVESVMRGTEEREPSVRIEVFRHGDRWGLSTTDNGPGVRDKEGRLLEPWEMRGVFGRGYSTKTAGGTGLGLSWVRQIVEGVHGGQLAIENLPDGGARATLILPPEPPASPPHAG